MGDIFFFFMDRGGYDWTMCVYVPRLCRNGNLTININRCCRNWIIGWTFKRIEIYH